MTLRDEYQILKILGHGAFATTYKVRHNQLGYVRAIKVLHERVSNEQDSAYQNFLRECSLMLKIGNGAHPNIVRFYQPRLIDNQALIEMDYIQGYALAQYLHNKPFMPINDVMRFVHEMGGALAYCHHDIYLFLMNPTDDHLMPDPNDASHYIITDQQREKLIQKYRVIHNDLHSNNIMRRDYDGGFVLLDFCHTSSSQAGAYEYMAPEKWDDGYATTTQSDIYSFGILLFEALTGRVPFEFDPNKFSNDLAALNEMRRLHQTEPAPTIEPLRREAFLKTNPGQVWEKDYPDWLEQMVQKCLAKDPADRYADAKELMEEFNKHAIKD